MKPKIATPISTLFSEPHAAERILRASDCLECRDFSINTPYPNQELFHCEYELVQPWSDMQRSRLQGIVSRITTLAVVSFHAAKRCEGHRLEHGMFQPEAVMFERNDLLRHAEENMHWLRSVLPKDITVAIENNNYYPTPAYGIVTDGDFLSDIVERNDIAFLFDIAHARITAHNRGIPYEEYRASLPLQRAVQLHLCSPEIPEEGMAMDVHDIPDNSILSEMEELLHFCPGIRYLTVEYYTDIEGLLESIRSIRRQLENM